MFDPVGMFNPAVYACYYCPGLLLSLTWFWGLLKIPLTCRPVGVSQLCSEASHRR